MTDTLKERFEKIWTCDKENGELGLGSVEMDVLLNFIRVEVGRAFKAVVPAIRNSPNPLKEDIVHNAGEKRDMLINQGWNACRTELLANIEKYLKSL